MFEFSTDDRVPAAMPVLSRGKHRNPSRGACFMEYTSLLAGEPFTDQPRCVDGRLAAILRGANDTLSDADRPLLLPLLGRAIGLVAGPPPAGGARWPAVPARRRSRREQVDRYDEEAERLRRAVVRRFIAGVRSSSSAAPTVFSGSGEQLARLFWDLMDEPTALSRSEDYVRRLIERLHLVHECYEEAMNDLGLPRTVPGGSVPADQGAPVAT
jgi:hypothetical protein